MTRHASSDSASIRRKQCIQRANAAVKRGSTPRREFVNAHSTRSYEATLGIQTHKLVESFQRIKRSSVAQLGARRCQIGRPEWTLESAHKKCSRKSIRPRGAKDVVTFPGAIGRKRYACVPSVTQMCRARQPGECIVAGERLPCLLQAAPRFD